ncbi:pyridoxal phosphate-dependent aminotransferase [bacterium]|nr:pyridoxal phosphate-dependent aminotransferase [bacterium]
MSSFESVDHAFLRKRSALKWGRWDDDVIALSVADIDFPPPQGIKDALLKVIEEDRTPYGMHAGDPDVLEVVCEKLNRINRIQASFDDVHMIPGTMFSIFISCYHALKPGDEAIICPAPIYPPFIQNIINAGATPVFSPVKYDNNCALDLDLLRSQINPRTKMIMICNPHNPCGRVLTQKELETVAELAIENDLLIFSDELYEDMVFKGKHISIASLSPEMMERTITSFGFSKAYGIPGYRIAYLVHRGKRMKILKEQIHDIIVHTDTLAQAAAKAALTQSGNWLPSLRKHINEMHGYALNRLRDMKGVWCSIPEATPFLFPNLVVYGLSSNEMTDYLLHEARIAVQSGSTFGPPGEGHIRINVGTSKAVIKEALDRMEKALKKLKINK